MPSSGLWAYMFLEYKNTYTFFFFLRINFVVYPWVFIGNCLLLPSQCWG